MTLEQFADLMGGLGYRAEKSERPKVRAEVKAAVVADVAETVAEGEATAPSAEDEAAEPVVPAETEALVAVETGDVPEQPGDASPEPVAHVEMEQVYTFVWAPRPRGTEARGPRRDRGEGRGRASQSTEALPQAADQAERPRSDRPRHDRPNRKPEAAGGPKQGGPRPTDGAREGYKGKPKGQGKPPERGQDRPRDQQPKTFEARPPREQKIDPDNPFAILAGLKVK
jgi:ATP-dependent RNA helicase SUPV3L1/SUV3